MIEVDVLPASSGQKGADSILVRVGTFDYSGNECRQVIVLIDGGFKENAKQVINHVKNVYRSDKIDYAISTHPDADHINGLIEITKSNELKIGFFLVHDPWQHSYAVKRKSRDSRATVSSIEKRLDDNLSALDDLLEEIDKKKIPRYEPSAGVTCGQGPVVTILGPTQAFYQQVLTEFPGMPNERQSTTNLEFELINYSPQGPHFIDNPVTSAKNDSSVITLIQDGAFKVLFCGDAGVPALESAIAFATGNGISVSQLDYFQIPHHGSIKNISRRVIDFLSPKSFFVSAPLSCEKHPSRLVLNYISGVLKKKVFHVSNAGLRIGNGVPDRPGWVPAKHVDVYPTVYVHKTIKA